VFGGRKHKNDLPVGIDVGDGGVRMLQLLIKGGEVQAKAASFAPLPEGIRPGNKGYAQALSAAMASAWERGGFSGSRVVSALPASVVQCKNLRLPIMPADELESAVQWEAADRFRMDQVQCSVQYIHAGQVNQGDEVRQELILLATKTGAVEEHLAALTGNHLRPVAIDAVPSALARLSAVRNALASNQEERNTVQVIIDAGQSSTKVLIAVDDQVRFYKPIEIGGATFDSVLSGAMSISLHEARELLRNLASSTAETVTEGDHAGQPARADVLEALQPTLSELSREIGLCLRYYGVTFRGARPTQAQLVGGAAMPWLAEALGGATGLSLNLDAPLGDIDLAAVRGTVKPAREAAWVVAAGLSVREHMKHFTAEPTAGESEDESVFSPTARAKGVAA